MARFGNHCSVYASIYKEVTWLQMSPKEVNNLLVVIVRSGAKMQDFSFLFSTDSWLRGEEARPEDNVWGESDYLCTSSLKPRINAVSLSQWQCGDLICVPRV